MITPKDLRDPSRKSGYRNVTAAFDSRPGRTNPLPYQARKDTSADGRAGSNRVWSGPRRATALESAQDFCDYVNAGKTAPPPRQLKSAGHKVQRDSLPRDPEVEAALGVLKDAKAQAAGKPGFVYLVIEEHPGGALKYGKVGYSTNPRARVGELQQGNPRPLKLHMMKPGTLEDEAAIHQRHIRSNQLQEWFRITPELLLEWDMEHYVKEDG